MKEYTIVMIGEGGDLATNDFEAVEKIFYFENRDFLEEEFERLISHGPIWAEYRLTAVKDLKERSGGKRRVASQYIRSEYESGEWESVHFYAVEFEGEKAPDDQYYIDFVSGYLDMYIDELDEEDKPEGKITVTASSKEAPGFTDFKKVFDRKKNDYYSPTLQHAIEFYQEHRLFSESIMDNIDNSTDELTDSEIDYECCPSDYHFCDFVDEEGKIIAEKLEAVKAEQGLD